MPLLLEVYETNSQRDIRYTYLPKPMDGHVRLFDHV